MTDLQLLKLAIASRPATKVAARAALKAAGLKQTLADALLAAVAEHKALSTSARRYARLHRRLGYCPVDTTARRGLWTDIDQPARPGPGAPARGHPATRLDARRRDAVDRLYSQTYRTAAHGEISVALTRDPAAVGIRQAERNEWDYAKSTRYPMRYQDTTITVPADWIVRVVRRGLGNVDGMMTLDASPLEGAPDGIELHAATWLMQGRGTAVTAQRGVIARTGRLSYHGTDAAQALAGLKRKQRAAQWDDTLRTADLAALIEKAGASIIVSIADAKAIGACEYGIKSWCYRTGLSYDAGRATLGDVYSAYQRDPAPEARAAMLHALRRSRRHLVAA